MGSRNSAGLKQPLPSSFPSNTRQKTAFTLSELRALHDQGFALHLLKPRSKVPVNSGWTTGARQSFDEFKRSYKKGYNIGVRLGGASKLKAGGYLAVLDLDVKSSDPKHQAEAEKRLFEIFPEAREAPCVLSGRGNGSAHYYVSVAEPIRGNEKLGQSDELARVAMPSVPPSKRESEALEMEELASGLRLRAAWEISLLSEGRHVVLPGSVHPDTGRLYHWKRGLDATSIPQIQPAKAPSAVKEPKLAPSPVSTTQLAPKLDSVDLGTLRLRPEQVEQIKHGTKVEDRSAALFSLTMALMQRGHSDDVILSVFTDKRNFLGQTAFEHANTTDRLKAAAWLSKYTLARARTQVDTTQSPQGKQSGNGPLQIIPFSSLTPKLENPLALVEGVLGHGGLSVLFGPSGAGKSFFAIYLTVRLATGKPFFGHQTDQVGALYLAAESPRSVEQRLLAYKEADGLIEAPLGVIPSTISLLADSERIIAAIETFSANCGTGVGLLVVDTLARSSAGSDENSAQDMGELIKSLDRVREATGVHIMIVHHAGKDISKGARGSSALRAACDTEIFLESLRATVTKQRDSNTGEKFQYELRQVSIGTNSEGEEILIPVVEELEGVREVRPLKGRKKQIHDVLKGLSKPGKEITKADWQAEFLLAAKAKDGQQENSLKRAFRKVAGYLAANNYVAEDAGFVRVLEGGQ